MWLTRVVGVALLAALVLMVAYGLLGAVLYFMDFPRLTFAGFTVGG